MLETPKSKSNITWKPYSRSQDMERAIIKKIQRAKTLALTKQNTDFNEQHVDWCRDAQKSMYTQLEKEITEKCKKDQADVIRRRNRKFVSE